MPQRMSRDREQAIIEAYEALQEGDSPAPILKQFGISRQTLYNTLTRNNIEPHRRRPTAGAVAALPVDVVAFFQMVEWFLDGLVDKKVVELTLDTLKARYGIV